MQRYILVRFINGFSLLELLIAVFILTFSLFGMLGVYIQSFKNIESSYQRTLDISRKIIEPHEKG